ncbi:MAG: glycosyltransferase family 4 protein [Candidatus Kaiserbacteria bacterium]|nr:glycosyltransferase family 4 protein [Candidatus Kaiserbacteria bacterium]
MKILYYLTTKSYPDFRADGVYVKELALAFSRDSRVQTTLIVNKNSDPELEDITMEVKVNGTTDRYRSLHSFVWLNRLFFKHLASSRFGKSSDIIVFFSNDPYLLVITGFLRFIYGGNFRIVSDWHQPFSPILTSIVLRLSDKAIVTSEFLKNKLSTFCKIKNKDFISVVYGGVDLSRFERVRKELNLRSTLELPQTDFIIGYIGGFRTMGLEKGILTMLDALALIPDQSVRMIFVGGTDEEIEFYTKEASMRGIMDRIIMRCRQGIEDIARYECISDILVIPYPNEHHFQLAFPMKVYEYIASKKPIIYSDLPLISEILGDCAVSFNPDDAKDLSEKILNLKNNPAQCEEFANKAYDNIMGFSWEKKAANIISSCISRTMS